MNPSALLNPKAYLKEQSKSKKKTPNYGPQQTRKQAAPTTYDPSKLLNPKAAASHVAHDSAEQSDEDAGSRQFGSGNMIEQLNGVTSREDMPSAKRRIQAMEDGDGEDEERKKHKGSFNGQSAGGTISGHMKEERLQMAKPIEAIDLTNEDDEVQIVKANDSNREVCLGVLRSSANVFRIPDPGNQRSAGKAMWPPFRASIFEPPAGGNKIDLLDKRGQKFGNLEPKIAGALAVVLQGALVNKTRFRLVVLPRARKPDETVGKMVSQNLKVDIHVYAPFSKADSLGRYFSQKQLFLETPIMESKVEVFNPQNPKPYTPKKAVAPKPQHAGPGVQRSAEEMRREAGTMFDNLAEAKDLPQMEANTAIITSDLMSHQKQALHFLMEHERDDYEDRESPQHSLWKHGAKPNGRASWYHVITGSEVFEKPTIIKGGILADEMGLGKTLSVLSLIAETREAAKQFRRSRVPDDIDAEKNAQATLIVCPKSVLSNWQEQIRNHTVPDILKVYTYHGATRNQDLHFLAKQDIILVSYNTCASEFGPGLRRNTALCSLNFFRIVLDEAHSIRNSTTSVFKAASALSADRRWAVSGTPVQNSLADLGALFRFLRLKPFDEPTVWAQYIMAPFKTGDEDVLEKLQLLVKSVSLRRVKDTISLPDRQEVREALEFTQEEALLYRQFATKSRSQFHKVTSGGTALKGKAYAHVLRALGRLRAICAHGREMLTEEDMAEIEGSDPGNAIVLDIGDELDPEDGFVSEKQAYSYLMMTEASEVDLCEACGKKLSGKQVRLNGAVDESSEESDDDAEDGSSNGDTDLLGIILPCYQFVCKECVPQHKEEVEDLVFADGYYHCQYCSAYQHVGSRDLCRSVLNQYREQQRGPKSKGARWDESTYSPHTKVRALIEDLKKSAEETKQLPEGEPPIRSVVFSGWTAYLDLIQHALKLNNFYCARIDGSMSVKERSQNLKLFNEVPEFTVLLVSIKAGGTGLNFTAASRCYVMEPQFNPGVEAQAVDRVHRIGQTRPVKIVHYIMKDSVEEGIVKLQEKKKALAKLSMENKKRTRSEENKARMAELRDLFK